MDTSVGLSVRMLIGLALMIFCSAGVRADDAVAPPRQVVDSCVYPGDRDARDAWKPMGGTAEVSPAEIGGRRGLKMPCNFRGTTIERASWDRDVKLDMTDARSLQFQFWCDDISSIQGFYIYLRSGKGWYRSSFGPAGKDSWTTVVIEKSRMTIEEAPAGWGSIDAIRISAWRGGEKDTVFYISDIEAVKSPVTVVIVRSESAATSAPQEVDSVCQFAGSMAQRLDELGIGHSMMSDMDLTTERIKDTALVILPHNPVMSNAASAVLEDYLKRGGKLLAFYNMPPRLEKATGIQSVEWVGEKYRGQFSRIANTAGKSGPLDGVKVDDLVANMPKEVGQRSWNIRAAKTMPGRSCEIAHWVDNDGKDSGYAAIVASDNAILMTHVLLDDNLPNKRMLLLAMAGHLVPDLWRQAAQASIDRMGRMGSHKEIGEAKVGPGAPYAVQAEAEREMALLSMKASKFAEAMTHAERGRSQVMKSWCLAEKPLPGETRLFWCHNPLGPEGMNWDSAAKLLAENGFTGIVVNMCWAGSAAYKSDVLPPMLDIQGDQLTECLEACRKYGLKCHVWKVNWNMGWRTPKEFMTRMKAEGRMQIGPDGKDIDRWLCPSNPDNRKLEIDSMVELATKYKVDGIHFDYIRYPGPEGCFCPGCRARFEKLLGRPVAHWPQDVQSGADRGKWLDFRRDNITAVVSAVAEKVRKAAPGVKISAAVFPNYPIDRDSVGQDWALWCEKGYLDFVYPMNYTPNNAQFQSMVERQRAWAGKVPYYPGIGLSTWNTRDILMLFDQIKITRQLRTSGFTIFEYSAVEAKEIVPLCGMGITKRTAD